VQRIGQVKDPKDVGTSANFMMNARFGPLMRPETRVFCENEMSGLWRISDPNFSQGEREPVIELLLNHI